MKNFYFPIHLNGGNRGCEAITRGTIDVLQIERNHYIGLCSNLIEDKKLGLDIICCLKEDESDKISSRIRRKIKKFFKKNNIDEINAFYEKKYDPFLNRITSKDVCLITGGDMFCYDDNELNYIIDVMHRKKVPTVLWGSSFGAENLTPAKLKALNQLSAITARESLTYDYFCNTLKLRNVELVADPAFVLQPQIVDLPTIFNEDVIGINLSNFVREKFSKESVFIKSFLDFLGYILKSSKLNVVLIPHVFWDDQDDRIVCNLIKDNMFQADRVKVLNTDNMNYCQIRYAISKCRFFIGARTHAMISAYYSSVPSLALGYSIKSRGIVKDIGLDEKLVLDYKIIKNADDLINRFDYLVKNESSIRNHLNKTMPDYIKKAYLANIIISNIQK